MATYVEPFDDGAEPMRAAGWKMPRAFDPLPPDVEAVPYTSGKIRHAVGWYWAGALIASLGLWYGVYLIIAFASAMFPFPVLR